MGWASGILFPARHSGANGHNSGRRWAMEIIGRHWLNVPFPEATTGLRHERIAVWHLKVRFYSVTSTAYIRRLR